MASGIKKTLAQVLPSGPLVFGCSARADVNRFDALVEDLKQALGPSSGLTSDDVDVDYLQRLMEEYKSNEQDWSKFAMGDKSRGYTRNLVDEGNGKSNLVSRTQRHVSLSQC